MKLHYIFIFLSFTSYWAGAQTLNRLYWPVQINGRQLDFPFTGGMNSPQFAAVDLTGDGITEIYAFDRAAQRHLAFRREGAGFEFAPELTAFFPNLENWIVLRDYNGDQVPDLFGFSSVPGIDGIEVHKGFYENGFLHFELVRFPKQDFDLLFFPISNGFLTQLFVSRVDYPAIDDIDNDGDLDVLTFNVTGGYVEWYKNESMERGFGRDTLIYRLSTSCWGGFYESGFYKSVDLSPTSGGCFRGFLPGQAPVRPRHAGSTLLTWDLDGDCDREIILGDISFNNLNMLVNGGTCQQAWINAQDTVFPNYDTPGDIYVFPAAFALDVDADGKQDMVVSPNNDVGSEDRLVTWWYKNTGTVEKPRFALQNKRWLVDQTIDLGSETKPAIADLNGDGLLDILVGYNYYQPQSFV